MTANAANTFRERARHEAERYGTDPWVFVRELLQNARDAGARHVWIESSTVDGRDRVCFRDDGSGMTYDHAQHYLFSLYASSKRGRSRTAGRFGIGFWAVLRFEPAEIVVRSRPHRGQAWQVRLDGRLETVRRERASMPPGTEVVLERRAAGDDLEQCLTASILRDAPFLCCRHRAGRPLEVRVNNRLVRAEPSLPPPSMSFRRRGLRGVVGLGLEPRAEIFAHGLRVRDAATLDELLVEGRPRPTALSGATEGLAPRVIIDSRDLEVLMARGDAREDRALRRLVAVGQRELRRLVRAELDRHARLSLAARLLARVGDWWSASRLTNVSLAICGALALGFFVHTVLSWLPDRGLGTTAARQDRSFAPPSPVPYKEMWNRYQGPDIGGFASSGPTVDLSYQPSNSSHSFAAIWVDGLGPDGRVERRHRNLVGAYRGPACAEQCLDIELRIDAEAGLLALPVATGHVVDSGSVRVGSRQLSVLALATGQPVVDFDRPRVGRLRYRTGPGRLDGDLDHGVWPSLPRDVVEFTRGLGELVPASRALEVAAYVRRRVAYDASPETAAKHLQARRHSIGLFDRAIAIGAGDCDVQNALVAAMLAHSGVRSRLAVGWIGVDGRARSGLHAWAEFVGPDGRWRAVDASTGGPATRPVDRVTASGESEPRPSAKRLPTWALVAAFTASVALLSVMFAAGRWRRRLHPGSADDITGLLRGATVRPRAFDPIRSLFSRRLLGLVSDRWISLGRAMELSRVGRLACGSRRSKLACRAARGGGVVLDVERRESAAVADVLAAVNLDRWSELLDRARGNALTARVEDRLQQGGEPCRVAIADRLGVDVAVLDGSGFGLGNDTRWIVLDAGGRTWQSIARWCEMRPARAALLLADSVLRRTGAPSTVRRRCLKRCALEALTESSAETP